MNRLLSSLKVFTLAGLILASCGQVAQPSPAIEQKPAVPQLTAPASKAGWEEKWNGVLAEAKKEGSVAIYSLWSSETRAALTKAFKDKYGISLEFTPFGGGSQFEAKIAAERNAGLYFADVIGVGGSPLLNISPLGLLGSIRPLLILPEVLDPKAWRAGEIPFADKEGQSLLLVGYVARTVVYNIDLIKEGEITTYRDLLKPQYKGRITLLDPSQPGSAVFAHLGYNVWGEAEAMNFLRTLIKEQGIVITRDNRLHVESVARGKYAIALAPSVTALTPFLAAGAPLKLAMVEEDTRTGAGSGVIGVPTKFAHPNAAIVFVNWLLTKEGESLFSRNFGYASTRLDVSTEGIDPLLIPVTGKKYYDGATQEFREAQVKWFKIAAKIIEEAAK